MRKSFTFLGCIVIILLLFLLITGCDSTRPNTETPIKTNTPSVEEKTESPINTPTTTATPEPENNKVCGYEFHYDGDVELYEDRIEMYVDARSFFSVAYFDLEQKDNFSISYRLDLLPDINYIQAGLYIKVSTDVWGKFMRSYADGVKIDFYGTEGSLWSFEEGKSGQVEDPFATNESIYMKTEAKDSMFNFYVSSDGNEWTSLGACTRLLGDNFEIGFSGASFVSGVNFEAVIDNIKIEYLNK